ncbi:MAG: SBBP repeat-containing protein [Candidatus Rokubacteria bacterium]|nr:SBBP repeat-containing protein [Candidatus Rokubacteria bacterium]
MRFEPNEGQADPSVKFLARGRGYGLFLTRTEAVLVLRQRKASSASVVRMKLEGAGAAPEVAGEERLPGKVNYFLGNDPSRWRADVPTYGRVRYRNVYPGVDLVYYGRERRLEYDFVVAPGADPRAIRIAFEGADAVELDARGDLIVRTATGELRLQKPHVYQEIGGKRVAVDGGFTLVREPCDAGACERLGRLVGVSVAAYDATEPLIVDPVLIYSTYLGGTLGEDEARIALDALGSLYVTGDTFSTDFPVANAAQASAAGGLDAFVTKLDPTGTVLVYSTYLGGTGHDEGEGIAVDGTGNAYVVGYTQSSSFPTLNPFQPSLGGSQDGWIAKLDPGGALVYSTYLGGSGSEAALGIAVDASGGAYVTGWTTSTNFPTANAFQSSSGGGSSDAFVTKLSATGSALVYSTYLGGSGSDQARQIAIDASVSAYVTGFTGSTDFPTANPVQPARNGVQDAFVTKLDATGALVYSTFLGGSGVDAGEGIAVDGSGNAYVTGDTTSTDFPNLSAVQPSYGGSRDAFVTKLNAAGTAIVYSTYLGGSGNDEGLSVAVDAGGNAYVVGNTSSTNFPTASALQPSYGGGFADAFVTKLDPTGAAFVYSTYLGGTGDDEAFGLAVDGSGNTYVAGFTDSTDFPTVNALQPALSADNDAFIAKIERFPSTPTAPTGLTATVLSPTRVSLGWTDASTDEDGFEIERDTGGGFALIGTSGAGVQVFEDTTVTANRTYTYRVRAVNGAGASDYSNTATVTVLTGKLVVLPARLTFFGTSVGSSQTGTVTLQNAGQGTLTGSVAAALTAPISLVSGGGVFSLSPGATKTVTIQFSPTARGTARGALTVTSDDPARPSTRVPITGVVR